VVLDRVSVAAEEAVSPAKKPVDPPVAYFDDGKCTECKRRSVVLVEQEPGIGPLGKEPRRLCPKCWSE
jgi:hypothetical protein